jgi:hypothetical protein
MGRVGTWVPPASTVRATTVSMVTSLGVALPPPKSGKLQAVSARIRTIDNIRSDLVFIQTSSWMASITGLSLIYLKDIRIIIINQVACLVIFRGNNFLKRNDRGCMEKRNYLIDMDGVLVSGKVMIPGADKFLERLKEKNKNFLVLTNNPIYTRGISRTGYNLPAWR